MKKIYLLIIALFLSFGNSYIVSATYDLALKKTIVNHGPYDVGNTVQFTVEVINQGDEDAENIRVTDYISSGLDLIDVSWTQTGAIDTGVFAEYEFDLIPAGESRNKTISYRITDRSESHIASHSEISRDDGDDCDSSPDRNILNDGILLDDYIGTECEDDSEIGEDDHDSEVITIKQRERSGFNFVVRSGPSVRTSQRSYVVVNRTHYIPVSRANEYINLPGNEPFIEIPIDIVVNDYEFRNNELLELEDYSGDISTNYDIQNNEKLINFGASSSGSFIEVAGDDGNISLYNTLINIAKSMKNLFYMIAGVFFLIIALRLIFASNTDEELGKFKKGVIWITVGLIVMQLALSFVTIGFDQGVSGEVGENIISIIVQPMILLLQTLASVFFMAVAIYAFYRLITANGNEEAIKSGKMTILYAIIGFMIVRFAGAIVNAFYGQVNCDSSSSSIVSTSEKYCRNEADLGQGINIIMSVITWLNSFVALAVMLMIIYAGFQILLSGGDEERIKKGKQSIIFVVIGLVILAVNYLILTFFLDIDNIPVI